MTDSAEFYLEPALVFNTTRVFLAVDFGSPGISLPTYALDLSCGQCLLEKLLLRERYLETGELSKVYTPTNLREFPKSPEYAETGLGLGTVYSDTTPLRFFHNCA